jgi:hypothetical protein
MSILEEAATISDIFEHVGDQPLINYVTLRAIPRRANLRLLMPDITDIWGGVEGLKIRKDKIYLKDGMPVRYIHWAGMKPAYRRPYVRLWLRYRYPGKKETLKRRLFLFYYLFLRSKRYLLYLLSGMKKKIGR